MLIEMLNGLNFRAIEITGFFDIVMVWNRGVSFGMLNGGAEVTRWLLAGLALAVSIALVVWLRRVTVRRQALALGLVIGGALGNALDRVFYGAVADFLDFHLGTWSWPAFNVADSAITVGVGLLLLDALLTPRSGPKLTP